MRKVQNEAVVMRFLEDITTTPIPKSIATGVADGELEGQGPYIITSFVDRISLDGVLLDEDWTLEKDIPIQSSEPSTGRLLMRESMRYGAFWHNLAIRESFPLEDLMPHGLDVEPFREVASPDGPETFGRRKVARRGEYEEQRGLKKPRLQY
ncbi:hypothetical protein GGS23DRAFT_593990 [Durotheca rogersii]|uniref:uncharacterized protein n=1 Tax=Durotheca rogersii TaxID=419775 RepID=UPI00221EB360|nr:uncharacterized protein GGS23DRAFT_593990 [Durotheca rogersii]KAI5865818.1 hypothetical protein GGS23DRAFT_593990 [Durotheca rogersii]